jgi:hypothetical protein
VGSLASLWRQSRGRFPGPGLWLLGNALQAVGLLLSGARGPVPALVSIIGSIGCLLAGALLVYVGLARFVARPYARAANLVLVVAFFAAICYFTSAGDSTTWRVILLTAAVAVVALQGGFLLLRRAPAPLRRMAEGAGLAYLAYALVCAYRIVETSLFPPPNDFLPAQVLDGVAVFALMMVSLSLTFALVLLVNTRLQWEVRRQAERFSKAFRSAPYALLLRRLADGRILEANDSFVAISGYSLAEAVGRTTLDLHL